MTALIILLKYTLYSAGVACIATGVVQKFRKGGKK